MSGGIAPSQGPRYGMISVSRDPGAEEQRVLLPVRQQPDRAEDPETDACARPDDHAEQDLAAHVRDERVLHPREQRLLARSRREPPVDRASEPLHVEQHVDRDDEQQDGAEERLADRDRGALDERDDLVRVLPDVALADLLHELVAARSILIDLRWCVFSQCCSRSTSRSAEVCPAAP